MKRQRTPIYFRRQRRGTVLIAVLACMAVATAIFLGALRVSITQRRQMRTELQMEQTQWLLDAAIQKASAIGADERDLTNETMIVSPRLAPHENAEIKIQFADNSARQNDDKGAENEIQSDKEVAGVKGYWKITARLGGTDQMSNPTQCSKEIQPKQNRTANGRE